MFEHTNKKKVSMEKSDDNKEAWLVSYQNHVADIRNWKNQQWLIAFYSLALLGAIVGFTNILSDNNYIKGTSKINDTLVIIFYISSIIITCVNTWLQFYTQRKLAIYRNIVQYLSVHKLRIASEYDKIYKTIDKRNYANKRTKKVVKFCYQGLYILIFVGIIIIVSFLIEWFLIGSLSKFFSFSIVIKLVVVIFALFWSSRKINTFNQ